jgi:pyruvate dehydrogenase E2 component (dihydrolipoamide acetyltransferase)
MLIEIKVPDVGTTADVDVVEVLIKAGDTIALEQTIATLEGDKASMELPATASGVVQQVLIKVGDKTRSGAVIATVETSDNTASSTTPPKASEPPPELAVSAPSPKPVEAQPVANSAPSTPSVAAPAPTLYQTNSGTKVHASPSVRMFARELGVDLSQLTIGTGRKGRILKEDVKNYIKKALTEGVASRGGTGIPSIPAVDFSVFGETETQKLSKIKRLTGQNLSRVWLNLPMVTYHDEVDITEMEAFRMALNSEKAKDEIKITGLMFIIKALVAAMKQFPSFNASLSSDGEGLILKKYFNIGIAVDTPNGLVVPVLRDVNNKSINQLAAELAEKSAKARQGKLLPADMQGGCLTISSLGGIGGTAFTPIVNAPEVAILGVTRAKMQPVWNGKEFVPRLMLPLDLTYDHRVIDGAEGARFMAFIKQNLSDIRRLLL